MDNNDSTFNSRGIICTLAQYERSLTDNSIHCLTRNESIGLTIVTQAGLVSVVAVSYVFTIILRNMIWRIRNLSRERLHVFHEPVDLLMFSLFSADVLQSIGAVMDIKWINDGKVEVGGFCNAQGIVKQLGETSVAMTTLVIAVYTFVGVWLGNPMKSMWVTRWVLMAVWLFVAFMIILGNIINRGKGKSHFQSPTPFWCWIGEDYLQWRIWGEYIWFWITLGFSLVIYIPLSLWERGNLLFDESTWWKVTFQKVDLTADPKLKVNRRRSLAMLAYPLVYCVSIIPLSVVRVMGFVQEQGNGVNHIPSTAIFAVTTIYSLSGACNVVLLLTTRPDSVLFGKAKHSASGYALSRRNSQEHSSPKGEGGEDVELGTLPSRSGAS